MLVLFAGHTQNHSHVHVVYYIHCGSVNQALLGSLYSSALISYVINGGYLFIKSLAIQCCNVSCSGTYIHVHKKIHVCVNAT